MLKKMSSLGTVLSKENQKKISGGEGLAGVEFYSCSCGFNNDSPIVVVANDLIDALQKMGNLCNGLGASCNGI